MKRIYLIGAVLVLLAIATVRVFYNNKKERASNIQNTVAANISSPIGQIPGPAVDNAPASPVIDLAPVQTEKTYTGRNVKKRHSARPVKHAVRPSVQQPVAEMDNAYSTTPLNANKMSLTATIKPDDALIVSSSNYYGKLPNRTLTMRNPTMRNHLARLGSRNVQFGPELGFNMNGFYNNQTSNMETGYMHAGIAVNIRMGDHFALQPVPRYIAKGNKRGDNMDAAVKEKLMLHYASLPVNLVYKIGRPGNARVMIGAGPYVSYLAGVKHSYSNGADGFSDVINPPVPAYSTSHIEDIDYGINGFMGIESPDGIYAKAGVEYGMKDIQRNPVTGINSDRNYSFLFSVGYLIGGVR